jgi:mannose-6-phosphate isomerase-like protein (cupin superfamily)
MTSDDTPSLWHDKEACESVGDIKYKPWGYYVDIHRTDDVVFKQIVVHPGEELSYQSHEKRDEFWFVKSGVGRLTMDSIEIEVSAGQSFPIYRKNKHTIKNIAERDLEIYEMQCGVCDENDIVRYSDKYGRD